MKNAIVLLFIVWGFSIQAMAQDNEKKNDNESSSYWKIKAKQKEEGFIRKITAGFSFEGYGFLSNHHQEKPFELENDLLANLTFHTPESYATISYSFGYNEIVLQATGEFSWAELYTYLTYTPRIEISRAAVGLEKPLFESHDNYFSVFTEIGASFKKDDTKWISTGMRFYFNGKIWSRSKHKDVIK